MVLNITGELPIMQWVDVFDDFLHQKITVRTILLSYVTKVTALASKPESVHRDDLSHGEEINSFEEELVAQVLHTHPFYRKNTAAVYYCLEEAV
eukprot:221077-Ditylum_brightwellii.AAC.1